MLCCVGYVSSSSVGVREAEIVKILEVSRDRNAKQNITGMLCYHDGNFLQFLEGERADIDDVLARIQKDKRHTGMLLMFDVPITERLFGNWSMALRHLQDIPTALRDDCCKLMASKVCDDAQAPSHSEEVRSFLNAFRESLR